ncbi:uncharacterized protein L3040_008177 [Drepanopeziza brunnea f. sp. 'multigermtubi']|uniref:uncharacterized protein n=1 Tax=Drepanopeziza brunnea f. sp. 'multigermtubi' TaxID=698441 RepID=UPI00239853EE|nr:hypothetical protein L3040_008177 [Drepanopeziza brunnea f. sp. 'multigermtubi']
MAETPEGLIANQVDGIVFGDELGDARLDGVVAGTAAVVWSAVVCGPGAVDAIELTDGEASSEVESPPPSVTLDKGATDVVSRSEVADGIRFPCEEGSTDKPSVLALDGFVTEEAIDDASLITRDVDCETAPVEMVAPLSDEGAVPVSWETVPKLRDAKEPLWDATPVLKADEVSSVKLPLAGAELVTDGSNVRAVELSTFRLLGDARLPEVTDRGAVADSVLNPELSAEVTVPVELSLYWLLLSPVGDAAVELEIWAVVVLSDETALDEPPCVLWSAVDVAELLDVRDKELVRLLALATNEFVDEVAMKERDETDREGVENPYDTPTRKSRSMKVEGSKLGPGKETQTEDPLGTLRLVVEAREFVVLDESKVSAEVDGRMDVLRLLMLAELENELAPSVEDISGVEEPLLDRAVKEGVDDRRPAELLARAEEVSSKAELEATLGELEASTVDTTWADGAEDDNVKLVRASAEDDNPRLELTGTERVEDELELGKTSIEDDGPNDDNVELGRTSGEDDGPKDDNIELVRASAEDDVPRPELTRIEKVEDKLELARTCVEDGLKDDNIELARASVEDGLKEENVELARTSVEERPVLKIGASMVEDDNVELSKTSIEDDNVEPSKTPVEDGLKDDNIELARASVEDGLKEENVELARTSVEEGPVLKIGASMVEDDNVELSMTSIEDDNVEPSKPPVEDGLKDDNIELVRAPSADERPVLKIGASMVEDDNVELSMTSIEDDNVEPSKPPVEDGLKDDNIELVRAPSADERPVLKIGASMVEDDNVELSMTSIEDDNVEPSKPPVEDGLKDDNIELVRAPSADERPVLNIGASMVEDDNVELSKTPIEDDNVELSRTPVEDGLKDDNIELVRAPPADERPVLEIGASMVEDDNVELSRTPVEDGLKDDNIELVRAPPAEDDNPRLELTRTERIEDELEVGASMVEDDNVELSKTPVEDGLKDDNMELVRVSVEDGFKDDNIELVRAPVEERPVLEIWASRVELD